VHKHFYGDWRANSQKLARKGKKSAKPERRKQEAWKIFQKTTQLAFDETTVTHSRLDVIDRLKAAKRS
jgi:hypothetical protein